MFTWGILLCDSKRSFYHFAELYICIYLDLKKWFCVRYVSSSLLALMSLSRLTRKKSPSLRCISQNRVSVILLNFFFLVFWRIWIEFKARLFDLDIYKLSKFQNWLLEIKGRFLMIWDFGSQTFFGERDCFQPIKWQEIQKQSLCSEN